MSIRLAILSDLHACDAQYENEHDSSYYSITRVDRTTKTCPLLSLEHFIQSDNLSADFVLCSGDITHRAKPHPLRIALDDLDKVTSALKAKALICTTGNHDLDSTYKYNQHDAKGNLLSIRPTFPVSEYAQSNEFWTRNFTLLEYPGVRFLILNSCAYHGFKDEDERKHGRISQTTVEAIDRALEAIAFNKDPRVNVLLCHHHPFPLPVSTINEAQAIKNGSALMGVLNKPRRGSWIIIHGHNHIGYTGYAAGNSSPPFILCAASFAIKNVSNHFYMLDLELSPTGGLLGKGRAYQWGYADEWKQASRTSGIPFEFGFGHREDAVAISHKVAEAMNNQLMDWSEMIAKLPWLEYVLHPDLEAGLDLLKEAGFRVHYSEGGRRVEQIQKP